MSRTSGTRWGWSDAAPQPSRPRLRCMVLSSASSPADIEVEPSTESTIIDEGRLPPLHLTGWSTSR